MNRDADIQNRLVDTVGEGEGEVNWESSTDIYTLPCVKPTASENCYVIEGAQCALCDNIQG